MSLSTTSVTSREFARIKEMPSRVAAAVLLNYLAMGGLILLLGWWLIDDAELWAGLVVIAAVPPAIAAVPWSYILDADIFLSLIGVSVSYLLALVITPLVMLLFLGADTFNPVDLIVLLGELVVIPLVVSRLLLFTRLNRYTDRHRGTVVNWSLFVVLFTIVGLNRQAFFTEAETLLTLSLIAVVTSFGLSYAIEYAAKALNATRSTTISLILVGAMKNFGLASGILLTLFSERAAVPASIMIVFFVFRTLWLSVHFRKSG
jgi:BASS family bile acid:Na+ symporter